MMSLARTVLVKELREGMRDRRSLLVAVAGTLAGPLVAGVAIAGRMSGTESAAPPPGLGAFAVFLLVSAFVMGMSFANDSTAGERERGSLEPLLLTQAPPLAVAVGKWGATAVLNVIGFVLTLACTLGILLWLRLDAPGLRPDAFAGLAGRLAIVGVPLALFASGSQIVVATHARSVREGQTSLSLLLFWPMISGMLLEFSRVQPAAWRLMLPVFGQHQLLSALLRGEVPGMVALLCSASVALAVSAGLVVHASRLLTRERILFGH